MIKPIGDYVVVKRAQAEEISKGGIFIPTTAQEKSIQAEVVATGPGKVLETGQVVEPSVKVGDKVIIAKWGGSEIKLDGVEHLFLRESEILAVFE